MNACLSHGGRRECEGEGGVFGKRAASQVPGNARRQRFCCAQVFLQVVPKLPGTGLRHPSFGGRCRKAMLGVWFSCRSSPNSQALVYAILPLEEGAGKRCSECAPTPPPHTHIHTPPSPILGKTNRTEVVPSASGPVLQTPSTGLRHPSFGGRCRKAMLGESSYPPPPPPRKTNRTEVVPSASDSVLIRNAATFLLIFCTRGADSAAMSSPAGIPSLYVCVGVWGVRTCPRMDLLAWSGRRGVVDGKGGGYEGGGGVGGRRRDHWLNITCYTCSKCFISLHSL